MKFASWKSSTLKSNSYEIVDVDMVPNEIYSDNELSIDFNNMVFIIAEQDENVNLGELRRDITKYECKQTYA